MRKPVRKAATAGEIGVTGLRTAGGLVDEEFLPQLRGEKARRTFREMAENDPIIGAFLYTIDMLVRRVKWDVKPPEGGSDEGKEFLEGALADMSHTWEDFISEAMTMLTYGWSYFEIVYKLRQGARPEGSREAGSKFTDGRVGFRKFAIRAQDTLSKWVFDEDGGIQAMEQQPPNGGRLLRIPIQKSLLFRTVTRKGSPEGRSLLRNAYRPWFYKKRLEEAEAIGYWRDLAGVPIAKIPASYMAPNAPDHEKLVFQQFVRMVRDMQADETAGIVMPSDRDDNGNPFFEFELAAGGGRRELGIRSAITDYNRQIAMVVLADFLMLGTDRGSYALSVNKTELFTAALETILKAVAAPLNLYAIPRLWALNGFPPETMPELAPQKVAKEDLSVLGDFISTLSHAGAELFPDPELENDLREKGSLPLLPEGRDRRKPRPKPKPQQEPEPE